MLEIRWSHTYQTLTGTELTAVDSDFFKSWTSLRVDVIANPQNSDYRTVSNEFLIEMVALIPQMCTNKRMTPMIREAV